MSSRNTAATASFESSHVQGAFSSGRLEVVLRYRTPDANQTSFISFSFAVPPDFHTHNDSVAAALMTLVGPRFANVTFNFAISEHCATILREYYTLHEVGPVDPQLVPRQPGRYLALNFSGGLDSTATWVLLHEVLGENFRTITSDYGPGFQREARAVRAFDPTLVCEANFRSFGLDQSGRFNCAVPLLYADYLDLHSLTNGHCFFQYPMSIESLRFDATPKFLVHDAVLQAGGLQELHLIRGIEMAGTAALLVRHAPHLVEGALAGSARAGTPKSVAKGLLLLRGYQHLGIAPPPAITALARARLPRMPADNIMAILYVLKRLDLGIHWRDVRSEVPTASLEKYESMTMNFAERYNPNMLQFIPEHYRERVLRAFHQAGIVPYTEREFQELEFLRNAWGMQGVAVEGMTPDSFRAVVNS